MLARGCPGPWKELVEAIVRPEIDEADENIGKIGLGLDVVQFAGLYQRRDDGPIFSTIIVTGEESILARQSLAAPPLLNSPVGDNCRQPGKACEASPRAERSGRSRHPAANLLEKRTKIQRDIGAALAVDEPPYSLQHYRFCFLLGTGRPARPAQPRRRAPVMLRSPALGGGVFFRNRDGPLDLRSHTRRGSSCGRRSRQGAYTMALASLNTLWRNTEQLNCTSSGLRISSRRLAFG